MVNHANNNINSFSYVYIRITILVLGVIYLTGYTTFYSANISTCSILVEGQQSDLSTVTSGVPQGTVLAPLLFLCFINDLPDGISSKVKLYANDVLLYATINTDQDCQQLQRDLDSLGKWAENWKMVFNYSKCEFLRITNRKHPILNYKVKKLRKLLMPSTWV